MKLLSYILYCIASLLPITAMAQGFSNLQNLSQGCNAEATWCVQVKGDSSVGATMLNATMVADAKNGSQSLMHNERSIHFNSHEYSILYADLSTIKQMQVTWIQYAVTKVDGRFISNCLVAANAPIIPGISTLLISKTKQGDYVCKKL